MTVPFKPSVNVEAIRPNEDREQIYRNDFVVKIYRPESPLGLAYMKSETRKLQARVRWTDVMRFFEPHEDFIYMHITQQQRNATGFTYKTKITNPTPEW